MNNLTKSGYFKVPTREERVNWISWAAGNFRMPNLNALIMSLETIN